jgi:hypothetical protein
MQHAVTVGTNHRQIGQLGESARLKIAKRCAVMGLDEVWFSIHNTKVEPADLAEQTAGVCRFEMGLHLLCQLRSALFVVVNAHPFRSLFGAEGIV